MYDLIYQFLYDSTGYENVGDWAVGEPKKYPVKWQADRLEMSQDTSINFFRRGTAEITIQNRTFYPDNNPAKWNVLLKGPRMGYTSFSVLSSPGSTIPVAWPLDSLFKGKIYSAKLLRSCEGKALGGYYFYEVKLPKKDLAYLKLSWITVGGNTAIRIDGYDSWSKFAAKFDCPQ